MDFDVLYRVTRAHTPQDIMSGHPVPVTFYGF